MKLIRMKRLSFAAALLILGLLSAMPAAAQISGGIRGTITGTDGKPLTGAMVVMTRTDISGHYQVKTDKKGKYGHYALPLGVFDVTVTLPGGQKVNIAKNVHTTLGNAQVVDANLQQMMKVANGEAPPPGMSKEEAAAYMAKLKAKEEQTKKLGKLNEYLAQNKQYVEAKQYDKAIEVMKEAVGLDQTHDILYANLAQDYADAKQYDNAVEAYQKAIALKPNEAAYVINLGTILSKEGKVQEANQQFAKAAAMDPSQAKMAMYNSAVVMLNSGNLDGAEQAFTKLLAMDPTNADAWYYKGICLLGKATTDPKTGKITPPPGTVDALKKSIELAPNGPNAANAKGALATLQGGGS